MAEQSHPTIEVTHKGQTLSGKWSGKNPPPEIGRRLAVSFQGNSQELVPGSTLRYFNQTDYLGVQIKLEALPKDAVNFCLLPSPEAVWKDGPRVLENYAGSDNAFTCGLFGMDIDPLLELTVPPTPEPLAMWHLGPDEEFAVLVAVILGGKKWKETLRDAWTTGTWSNTPYEAFCGELQRVRNTGHMDFVDYAVSKNLKYINGCQSGLFFHKYK